MYGYPCNTPSGFTADEARQATANALRFWLSENGESGSYSFTNRKANPNYIRAKSGYEHVLAWADELLSYARARKTLNHSITFSPSSLTLAASGDSFVGQAQVRLTNINSGYTLNSSNLPSGVTVSGYTGSGNDTLTITAPESAMGQSFSITATGNLPFRNYYLRELKVPDPGIHIMQVVPVGNHLNQLQRHHDSQDHSSNRHHDGVGEVLDHAENTPVPALGGLAHLCRNVCDLLVHAIEHPR